MNEKLYYILGRIEGTAEGTANPQVKQALAELAKVMREMLEERTDPIECDCADCRHAEKSESEYPCKSCMKMYNNFFEKK